VKVCEYRDKKKTPKKHFKLFQFCMHYKTGTGWELRSCNYIFYHMANMIKILPWLTAGTKTRAIAKGLQVKNENKPVIRTQT